MKMLFLFSILMFAALTLLNLMVYLSGVTAPNYAFSVLEPISFNFLISQFVHSDFTHLIENLIGFIFGSGLIIGYSFFFNDEDALIYYMLLMLLGFSAVLPGSYLNYFFNGTTYSFGFSGVSVAVLTFGCLIMPELAIGFVQRWSSIKLSELLNTLYIAIFQIILLITLLIAIFNGNIYTHLVSYSSAILFYIYLLLRSDRYPLQENLFKPPNS